MFLNPNQKEIGPASLLEASMLAYHGPKKLISFL